LAHNLALDNKYPMVLINVVLVVHLETAHSIISMETLRWVSLGTSEWVPDRPCKTPKPLIPGQNIFDSNLYFSITNRAPLLCLEPFVEAAGVELVVAAPQLLEHLVLFEVVETNRAGVIPRVLGAFHPLAHRYFGDLLGAEAFAHFTIFVFQFEQLLICHVVRVRGIAILLALL